MYFTKDISNINTDITEVLQNLISLYFEHDYEGICKILKINKDKYSNIKSNKYYDNKGLTFCDDDNPLIFRRIYVDDEIKRTLNSLLMVINNSVEEKDFIDLIINKWIKKVNVYGLPEPNSIPKIIGKETYIQLKVGKKSWNDMSMACKNKDILMKTGFKMMLLSYLDELCSNY